MTVVPCPRLIAADLDVEDTIGDLAGQHKKPSARMTASDESGSAPRPAAAAIGATQQHGSTPALRPVSSGQSDGDPECVGARRVMLP